MRTVPQTPDADADCGPKEPGERLHPTWLALSWWHAGMAGAVAFTAVWTLADGPLGARRAVALVLYAALCAWYVIAPGGLPRRGEGRLYLAGALALYLGAAICTPDSGFLLFVLIPQCFVILEPRGGWVTVVGLAVVSSASQLNAHGDSEGNVVSIAIFGVMTILLALLITGWVSRIAEQSAQRADLIEELDRTRAELAQVSRAAGTTAERARLAGEIHDTLAQGFTSILMLLQAAQAALPLDVSYVDAVDPTGVAVVRTQLSLAESTARDGLAEARSLVDDLAPVALQSGTLTEAVARVTADFELRTGIRTHLEVVGDPVSLPSTAEVVLLRATQEALANVSRHALARQATVSLGYETGGPHLTVTDDGRGFDQDAVTGGGYGLRGMRARVEQVGGRLRVRSAPGQGTTVELTLP